MCISKFKWFLGVQKRYGFRKSQCVWNLSKVRALVDMLHGGSGESRTEVSAQTWLLRAFKTPKCVIYMLLDIILKFKLRFVKFWINFRILSAHLKLIASVRPYILCHLRQTHHIYFRLSQREVLRVRPWNLAWKMFKTVSALEPTTQIFVKNGFSSIFWHKTSNICYD